MNNIRITNNNMSNNNVDINKYKKRLSMK